MHTVTVSTALAKYIYSSQVVDILSFVVMGNKEATEPRTDNVH